MAGQTIPVSTANSMISAYFTYMSNLGVNMEEQTQSVSFSKDAVMDYLKEAMEFADELRVFKGADPGETELPRTSVILWPYLNGEPAQNNASNFIDPFNDGSRNP